MAQPPAVARLNIMHRAVKPDIATVIIFAIIRFSSFYFVRYVI